ncbi:MAG: lactate racemase domain-containing protein [Spirochaetia bacterium]|jgi:nickel-dependent lactate racemase|nr:lactate racemase domain-containing protein [Spirochaetia bacterium]
MLYYKKGSSNSILTDADLREGLFEALGKLESENRLHKVLAVPPDFTRVHSKAGILTSNAYEYLGKKLTDILPALGTHTPMTELEISKMFPGVPLSLFREHKWKEDLFTLGTVPGSFVSEQSNGKLDFDWPAQVNSLLVEGNFDLILSIGQVVPHEVVGMANFNKNIFVGTGGSEGINKSHFIGAVYGMERMMGRADTPVRRVLNYASDNFAQNLPIIYVQTVVGIDDEGELVTRGLFIGDDKECFEKASELSLEVNFKMLDKPLKKVVVYLDPEEFRSTWLGNKSIYRTRMAIADGGKLIVLAPGVKEFGEDPEIDRLIRKYGYFGTDKTLEFVKQNKELQDSLGAAAHLIHGSTEGRFSIIYCPGHLSRDEIESVNFEYASMREMINKYNPEKLKDGFNTLPDGEVVYYISNPALGLWAHKDRFREEI